LHPSKQVLDPHCAAKANEDSMPSSQRHQHVDVTLSPTTKSTSVPATINTNKEAPDIIVEALGKQRTEDNTEETKKEKLMGNTETCNNTNTIQQYVNNKYFCY
jgi:hypothetical protein